jgi:hypothetical protein
VSCGQKVEIDVTKNSPEKYREFIDGLLESGEAEVEVPILTSPFWKDPILGIGQEVTFDLEGARYRAVVIEPIGCSYSGKVRIRERIEQ